MENLANKILTSILSLMVSESLFENDKNKTTEPTRDKFESINTECDDEDTICEHCDAVWNGSKHIYFCRWCKGK